MKFANRTAKSQPASLLDGIVACDRRSIARAISLIEAGGAFGDELYRQICSVPRTSPIVGFTGPPGVGKSTLVGAYIGHLRKQGKTVSVAAVDPSSPLSGGAILGDRVRMVDHDGDEGVFIRSLGSHGQAGGLSATLYRVADVLSAARYDIVIVETVGTGQTDVDVSDVADVTVVVTSPGLGDEVQAIKAGILEIADILVINKADLPRADRMVVQLEAMLKLRKGAARDVPIVSAVATRATGIAELGAAVDGRVALNSMIDRPTRARMRVQKLLARAAARDVFERLASKQSVELVQLCENIATGRERFTSGTRAALAIICTEMSTILATDELRR
jgi:LAO/AO transport system kinase